jgi:hypothetical protein
MTGLAIGTIVGRNYLPFARVLAGSLHARHPEVGLVVVVADAVDDHPHESGELFSRLTPEELSVPDLNRLRFRTTRQELVVALKPFLLATLLERAPSALFLDSDVLVLGQLDEFFAAVQKHSVTLVPHALEPPRTPDGIARDLVLNLSGAFNGGVVGVSHSPEAAGFLTWWQKRVHRFCMHNVQKGMHFDQRWLDLAPGFIEDLHLCRDVGVNVAHWNLPERPISIQDGTVTAGGVPCRLFHFSGFDPDNPKRATRYRPGLRVEEFGQGEQLFGNYARALHSAGWPEARLMRYAYESFNNGVRIPEAARRLYAELPQPSRFGNPFDAAPRGSYFQWLKRRPLGRRGFRSPNRLWQFIHRQRPDLQRVFPHPEGSDRRAFLAWTRTHGMREHQVPPELA